MPRRYALWGTLVPAILITLALGLSLRPPSLRAADRVQGDMGLLVSDLSPEACRAAGVAHGVLVIDVAPGGPADKKGIEVGDIITEYENQPVRSALELMSRIRHDGDGFLALLRISRDGSERLIGFVQLAARPGPPPAAEELNSRFDRLEDEIDDLRGRIAVLEKRSDQIEDLRARVSSLEKRRAIPRRPAVVSDSIGTRSRD